MNWNWNECIICITDEELRCLKNPRNFDALLVYREFLENVSEFLKLDDVSVDLPFAEVAAHTIFDRNSSWHPVCRQKFTKSCLEKAKNKNDDQSLSWSN